MDAVHWIEMSAGKAALAIFVNALAGKVYMSSTRASFQIRESLSSKGLMKAAGKMMKDEETVVASKAQLNNSEYSGLLCAALCFIHISQQGDEHVCGPDFKCDGTAAGLSGMTSQIELASGLIVLGSILHLWGQILWGPFPFQTLGGLPRYVGMFLLVPVLQVATMRNVKQFDPSYQAKFETVTVPQ
ncbi:hypothetical protein TL16_g06824 [Triparma laevis f. inornata]|uniref:Uncharacterized protein n=1 Tax=Triparma laevis f. inornata TaxID=1714386 RepID=A0A9W7AS36_9STRA|nr:hypothetical protein TL16_g06824 [Triparma laevis f. inornata]